MKKIGLKNYIIYILIVFVTVALAIVFSFWYKNIKDEQTTKSMTAIAEIKETDLDNYLTENNNIIIYLGNSKKESLKEFEEEFNKYINEESLNKNIIYIDLSEVSKNFDKKIKNKFNETSNFNNLDVNFNNDENIIVIEESKLVNILYRKTSDIKIEEVKIFLKEIQE